jgi:hypothetical protein
MIDLTIENTGTLEYTVNNLSESHVVIEFYGKNYKTNPDDYVIIKDIYYKDLLLNELFEYTSMTTDNADYNNLSNVDYVSFNGVWQLKFTEDDVKSILKRKLS